MDISKNDTAVLVTDPQNDFLSEKGVTWQLVGDSVTENNTIENIERLFKAAKSNGFQVFISPHYYYPTDHSWQFGGTVENMMHEIKMFDRDGALSLQGFTGSGADWLERYKPLIEDGKTVVASPHKVYGPENNGATSPARCPARTRARALARTNESSTCRGRGPAGWRRPWLSSIDRDRTLVERC